MTTKHQHIILESNATVGGSELDVSDPEIITVYNDVKDDKTKTNWYVLINKHNEQYPPYQLNSTLGLCLDMYQKQTKLW